jgi:CheY-like chemotaxis protein
MPGKDGYELVREIRRREALAAPAARDPGDRADVVHADAGRGPGEGAGFDLHCPKPLKPLQLIQQIRQLTGRT